jgi:hypothetical protein
MGGTSASELLRRAERLEEAMVWINHHYTDEILRLRKLVVRIESMIEKDPSLPIASINDIVKAEIGGEDVMVKGKKHAVWCPRETEYDHRMAARVAAACDHFETRNPGVKISLRRGGVPSR